MKKTLVFLLCRNLSKYISLLESNLIYSNIDTIIVNDSAINNDILYKENFTNLCRIKSSGELLKTTAWEKSFYEINTNNLINIYDYFYFIEDDVYTKNPHTIISFIKHFSSLDCDLLSRVILSINDDKNWSGWEFNDNYEYKKLFYNIYRSFNPFCRLSSKLVSLILEFRKIYQKFYFHEILFSSICIDNNLSYYDYKKDKESNNKYIGTFTYRPIILKKNILDNKIYHPVKKH